MLLWWAGGDTAQLSQAARRAIAAALRGGRILVSAISAWELAMLVDRGRVDLSMDIEAWLATVREIEAVQFVPVDTEIAVRSVTLPGTLHKDPADRLIVATARQHGAALVTADEKLRGYPHVRTVW